MRSAPGQAKRFGRKGADGAAARIHVRFFGCSVGKRVFYTRRTQFFFRHVSMALTILQKSVLLDTWLYKRAGNITELIPN